MAQLQENDAFPRLEADSVAHGRVVLPPPEEGTRFSVILAYRALW